MEAADTSKKEHGKEEKQHNHNNSHNHKHNHHQNHREEHVGGRDIDLVEYIDFDAQSVAGAFLEKKYLALTGKKYDKVEGLIGPEQLARARKEEEEGRVKNKGVIYEF